MADTNIRFNIGSTFSGEGFEAASKAINENRKELAASARGLGELTKAFEGISPGAANAVGAVKTFTQAFLAGGIVGGAIQLAIQGISKAIEYGVERFHEAAKAAKKYAEILKDNVLAAMGDTSSAFAMLSNQIDESTKRAKDLLAVLNGDIAHDAANMVAQVNMDKLNALMNAMSESEKGIIEATAAYKIALINAQAKEEETANAIETYRLAVDNATKIKAAAADRAAKADEGLAAETEKCKEYIFLRQRAERYLEVMENDYANGRKTQIEVIRARKAVALKIAELENTYADDVRRLKTATDGAAKAHADESAAEYALTQAQQALHASVQKHDEAVQAVTLAETEGQYKLQEAQKKHSEALEKETEKRATEAMKQLDAVMAMEGDLRDATKELSDARKKAAKDTKGEGSDGEGGKGKCDGGKVRDVKVTNAKDIGSSFSASANVDGINQNILKPKGLSSEVFERIKNGTANVADFKALDRFMAREERDAKSSRHRIGADAARFISNADKPDSWLSTRDREFQETFKSRVLQQLPADVAKELLGNAGKHLLCTESMKEILGNEKIIDAWLGKLGLK